MDEAYVGAIMLWAGTYVPQGWLACEGQTLSINQNQALFAVIGIQFGGDGSTNFKLPDLRSRVPVGKGQGQAPGLSNYNMGQTGGVETVTLTTQQMPMHNHALSGTASVPTAGLQVTAVMPASDQPASTDTPGGGNVPAKSPDFASQGLPDVHIYGAPDGTTTLPVNVSVSGTMTANLSSVQISPAGGGGAHENRQPFLGLQYIICTMGLFPPHP
ncbi:MAG TPA: tail fiber protein [Flavisolibacter sp.]|jgi:microcystin-dependent protein